MSEEVKVGDVFEDQDMRGRETPRRITVTAIDGRFAHVRGGDGKSRNTCIKVERILTPRLFKRVGGGS